MGLVIPFRRKYQPPLVAEERELLDRIRGSLRALWRGGWAMPGEAAGVALMRNQHCVGIWTFEQSMFVYRAIESGEAKARVESVEAAYHHCLVLLGEVRPRERI